MADEGAVAGHAPLTTRGHVTTDGTVTRAAASSMASGFAAYGRGHILGIGGRFDDARTYFLEAFARFGVAGEGRTQLVVRSDMAHALRQAGRLDDALVEYRHTILEWKRLGHRGAVANQLESFAFVARQAGKVERAVTLLSGRSPSGAGGRPHARAGTGEHGAELEALEPATFARAWADGQVLSIDGAVALALERGATATLPGEPRSGRSAASMGPAGEP